MNKQNEIVEVKAQPMAPLDMPLIRTQVELAKQYPRESEGSIANSILEELSADREFAEMSYYNKPVGKDDNGNMKYAQGASVRLAEFVATRWGNLTIQISAQEVPDGVIGRYRIFDAQSVTALEGEIKRAYTSRKPQAMQNTYNAAMSIAYRNGVFRVVPKAIAEKLWRRAEQIASRKKGSDKSRVRLVEAFQQLNITEKQLCEYAMVEAIEDIGPKQIADLRGLWTAIRDGDVDKESLFPSAPKSGGSKINKRSATEDVPSDESLEEAFGDEK